MKVLSLAEVGGLGEGCGVGFCLASWKRTPEYSMPEPTTKSGDSKSRAHQRGALMRTRLESLLSERLTGVEFFTDCDGPRLPNTICVGFDGVEGQTLMIRLDIEGISVSTGTACGSGSLSPSPVLSAMGLPLEKIGGMVRVSFGRNNTLEEVDRFFAALQRLVCDCRQSISTVGQSGL